MTSKALIAPGSDAIRSAVKALSPYSVSTPLLRFDRPAQSAGIFLKLECMQAIGAFKVRPIGNILLNAPADSLRNGTYTASSGNAGLALAWMARKLEIPATVYAPDSSPPGKLAAIRGLGAQVSMLSDDDWWQLMVEGRHPDDPGIYVDAVRNPQALAGNATIGHEILRQCPDVDTVITPFGGGGLSCGIASAIRQVKPDTRIIVAECESAAPLNAAFRAGRPVPVEMQSSIVSGAGAPSVLQEMWPLLNQLIDDSVVVPESAVTDAVRDLFLKTKIVAEGAGAVALAGARSAGRDFRKTACIVSGGNIDATEMTAILRTAEENVAGASEESD
ncbi:MAG: pyridoxal-phosphate dependent enzyme [Woeseiaceae bacterium]|nr:pyridoxal-phosphate dependent enzyme [Woeseiaceae bacterium]